MPSKYPVLKPNEIINKISKKGFYLKSQRGSHVKYTDGINTCIIPMHDEVAKGTLKSILEQANISLDEFMEL